MGLGSGRTPTGAGSIVLALALSVATALPAAAQATPGATPPVSFPVVPHPEECRVALRQLPLPAGAPAATPIPIASPTPVAAPTGEPADPATVAGVTATIREAVACRNAGDFRRAYSLFTDAMLVRLFGSAETVDPEILLALSERNRRLPRDQRLSLDAVADVRVGPDGRVSAVVETSSRDGVFRDLLFLVERDGRWLIDEAIALPAAAATPQP